MSSNIKTTDRKNIYPESTNEFPRFKKKKKKKSDILVKLKHSNVIFL